MRRNVTIQKLKKVVLDLGITRTILVITTRNISSTEWRSRSIRVSTAKVERTGDRLLIEAVTYFRSRIAKKVSNKLWFNGRNLDSYLQLPRSSCSRQLPAVDQPRR